MVAALMKEGARGRESIYFVDLISLLAKHGLEVGETGSITVAKAAADEQVCCCLDAAGWTGKESAVLSVEEGLFNAHPLLAGAHALAALCGVDVGRVAERAVALGVCDCQCRHLPGGLFSVGWLAGGWRSPVKPAASSATSPSVHLAVVFLQVQERQGKLQPVDLVGARRRRTAEFQLCHHCTANGTQGWSVGV